MISRTHKSVRLGAAAMNSRNHNLSLRVISLGAGVQSTAMALMAAHGEITPMPDCAIFADTQNETERTYEHLRWLMSDNVLPFRVHKVSKGNLEQDFIAALRGEKNRCGQPPFFVRNPDNDGTAAAVSGGMLWRQCTKEYKLDAIRKIVRALSGGKPVEQWIGISTDEAHRMKVSGVKYITNRYPLVEKRLSRSDCMAWLKRHDYPIPGKSACYFCPYTSNHRWLAMKRDEPEEFGRAAAFDDALRVRRVAKLAAGIKGEIFVHRSMTPLRTADLGDDQTGDLFGNECEGLCGV